MPARPRRAAAEAASAAIARTLAPRPIRRRISRPTPPVRRPSFTTTTDLTSPCAICMDTLNLKRVAVLVPCGHALHETCSRRYMESKEYGFEQNCPLCRVDVNDIKNEDGTRCKPLYFGEIRQPTYSTVPVNNWSVLHTLHHLKKETQERLACCKSLRKQEGFKTKNVEYKEDVQEETVEVKKRLKKLKEMWQNRSYDLWDEQRMKEYRKRHRKREAEERREMEEEIRIREEGLQREREQRGLSWNGQEDAARNEEEEESTADDERAEIGRMDDPTWPRMVVRNALSMYNYHLR